MATQIRMTPQELREAADFIDQRKNSIMEEVTSLKQRVDQVTGNWEGAAQSSFVATFEEQLYPILKDTAPQVMEGLCAQLKGAADAIEKADEEVANAFKS